MNRAEENRLQLVANEINLGLTLIESARLAFSMGHTEHGEKASAKAEDAYRGARHFLGDQTGDDTSNSLQHAVSRLRSALDDLQADVKNNSPSQAE